VSAEADPAMEGGAEPDDGPFDVYEHHSDPFIGETVVLSFGETRVGGTVQRATINEDGDPPVVDIARPDGEVTRVAWGLVETVNSRISVQSYGCESCGAISEQCYRCSECGHDLAGSSPTVGRHGGDA